MEHSNTDARYLSIAAEEAEKSIACYRVGCVAVSSGKIVARGYNSARTYSKDGMIGDSLSCHAEIDVLRKCLRRNITNKMKLYIVRITATGECVCSAPCIDCFMAMQEFNIKDIVYIGHEGEILKRSMCDFHTSHRSGGKKAVIENRVKRLKI
tara:strand:- start:4712 stop:5170 length:459 start_codon:yes stop_codon:yes gene_type:complete